MERRRRKEYRRKMERYTFIGYILLPSKMNRENIIQRMQTMKEVENGDQIERTYIKTTAMSDMDLFYGGEAAQRGMRGDCPSLC